MWFAQKVCGLVLAMALVLTVQGVGAELSVDDTVELMANRLRQSQVYDDPNLGLWPGEENFMGPTVAGMVCAYEWTGEDSYRWSAAFGTAYLVHMADLQGNLLGDEAYAILKMSEAIQPLDNPYQADIWRDVLLEFYDGLRRPGYEGSTAKYIEYFDDLDPSTNVFYFAHHLLAAYYIDDPEKDVWRDALISWLSRVDDTSTFPVLALGVATWALAQVNELDDTPLASASSVPYWDDVVLSDLPQLLLGHQVPQDEPYGGSFYWRFDHTAGGTESLAAGYTEDTVYGTLGLAAAASLKPDLLQSEDVTQAILWAQGALLLGVDAGGNVYQHLSCQGETRYAFAGEMLQALWGVKQYLDAQVDDSQTDDTTPPADNEG